MDTHTDSVPLAEEAPALAPADSPPQVRMEGIGRLTIVAITALLGLMLARVVQLQVAPGGTLASFISPRLTNTPEPGVRGDLLDRRGKLLAGSHFAKRVFVDPTEFPDPPDQAMTRLAEVMGLPLAEVAERIVPRMAENQRRMLHPTCSIDHPTSEVSLVRYVSIGRIIDEDRAAAVKGLAIKGVHFETRSVREITGGVLTASIVGKVGADEDGILGAEKTLEPVLKPAAGRLQYVRDAGGRPMWVEPGGYVAPERGQDTRLSIDLEVQRIATEELQRGVDDADAAGGRLVVLDPHTGEVLSMVDIIRPIKGAVQYNWDRPIQQDGHPRYITINRDPNRAAEADLARNRCVEDVYEPGSTFKPFMWSEVNLYGLARIDEVIDTEGGHWVTPYGRHINDVTMRDHMTWSEVLVNSSNIGMSKVTSRMSYKQMRDAVVKYGFGSKTGIGLPGESPGIVTSMKSWSKYSQTSVAMGHEVAVTPLQMVRAFAAFARTGDQAGTLPTIRLTAAPAEELTSSTAPRVLPRELAELTRQTMRGVTHNLDQRMTKKDPEANQFHYEAFGKSGTAEIPLGPPPKGKKRPKGSDGYYEGQYNSSFIAAGPVEDPRVVVLVVIDDPGPQLVRERRHYGASVAGPVNRRVMERVLAYLGAPPSYPSGNAAVAAAE